MNGFPHDYICPQAWRTALPEELYPTRYIEERTLDYLDQCAGSTDPFFLLVSFPDPHHPFTPPGQYWDMYNPADMPLDPSFQRTKGPLPQVKWARAQRRTNPDVVDGYGAFAATEREVREAMALTCGMITMIDDAVGRIVAHLTASRPQTETVLIFASDHGDLLGDHGMMLKGPVHFQSLIRVPLIWADPRYSKQSVSNGLCSTIDISATVLARAGIHTYNGLQGRSLIPALAGGDIREWVLIEEDAQEAQFGLDEAARLRTLVTRQFRLTISDSSNAGELFNLLDDPAELSNRWNDPKYRGVKCRLLENLARAQMDLADRSPLPLYLA